MLIKKIDIRLFKDSLPPLFGGIAFFCFIFLMFQTLRLAEFVILKGVSIQTALELSYYLILTFLPMVLPISFLISLLLTFGRLSVESELIALKALGYSIYRLTWTPLFLSLLVTLLSFILNLNLAPSARRSFKTLLVEAGNTALTSSLKSGTFTKDFFNLLIFTDRFDPKKKKLNKVFIYDERDQNHPMVISSHEGSLTPILKNTSHNVAATLLLKNGKIYTQNREEKSLQVADFDFYQLYLSFEVEPDDSLMRPMQLKTNELLEKIKQHPFSTMEHKESLTELWRRISISISPLFFLFLGIGAGSFRVRAVKSSAAATSFLVIFVYWFLLTFMTPLAHSGSLHPILAMMIPNLLIGIVALFTYQKATW